MIARHPAPRVAGFIGAGVLLAVYVATLAPGVTFWDAGEFIAAAHSLGIPHPPGTPLYVLLLNVWARVFWFLPFAAATNLFSAACTATAAGLLGGWIARAMAGEGRPAAIAYGAAAAIAAGAGSTAWLNATETEVYSAALLLSVLTVLAGDRAGRSGEWRWRLLTAYLMALAVPLHLSALVAAPVAIYLAARPPGEQGTDWITGATLSSVLLLAVGVGTARWAVAGAGIALAIAATTLAMREREAGAHGAAARAGICGIAVTAVALSALLFMLVRAQHDPAVNQGNPADLAALSDVVARRQYAVPPPWPRSAPLWLQIANWFPYADWQVALSLGPTPIPTAGRGLASLAFASLMVWGAIAHRRADRRRWRGMALLALCGSLGVVLYLNLKAGPSFGHGVLPDGAPREARERDYFFILSFVGLGAWAGVGAVALARRLRAPAALGVVLAALPIALNWSAVDRRREPEASLPRDVALSLLLGLPERAVLFVAGDNDTYPLWYAQQVENVRRDVTVVTLPLLGADWYVNELGRRHGLAPETPGRHYLHIAAEIATLARSRGRPVAAALTLPESERNQLIGEWKVALLAAVERPIVDNRQPTQLQVVPQAALDAARRLRGRLAVQRPGRTPNIGTDPVNYHFHRVLHCVLETTESTHSEVPASSLDSICNLR